MKDFYEPEVPGVWRVWRLWLVAVNREFGDRAHVRHSHPAKKKNAEPNWGTETFLDTGGPQRDGFVLFHSFRKKNAKKGRQLHSGPPLP